jgi:hypothetical protein
MTAEPSHQGGENGGTKTFPTKAIQKKEGRKKKEKLDLGAGMVR